MGYVFVIVYSCSLTLSLLKALCHRFGSAHLLKIAAKDEWDFEYLGNSNHPFIKANYPHHEGIW